MQVPESCLQASSQVPPLGRDCHIGVLQVQGELDKSVTHQVVTGSRAKQLRELNSDATKLPEPASGLKRRAS